MERVYLPSNKALGLDMPDRKYTSRRGQDGYVEVSDADAALLRQHTGLQVGEKFSVPTAPGLTCSKCGFGQYAAFASPLCTRCGSEWESDSSIGADKSTESGRRVKVYDI